MIYLDTSVLGAIFFREPGAVNVLERIEAVREEGLAAARNGMAVLASG